MKETPVPLTQLSESEKAKVVQVDGPEALRLSGFGLYPGVIVRVHQKFPSIVIKTDETELALESEVAGSIKVVRSDDSESVSS